MHCNLVTYMCYDLGCLPYCMLGRVNDFSVLAVFVSRSLIKSCISIYHLCLYSTLLHHPLLCLPMDPLCLFLLWRKGWWQREQMLGKNAPLFFCTQLHAILECDNEEYEFHSNDLGEADQYVNAKMPWSNF